MTSQSGQGVPLLEAQKGFSSLAQRVFRLEKQMVASRAVRKGMEALTQELLSFFESIQPLLNRNFVRMRNKKVWFDRKNAALFPMFEAVALPVFDTARQSVRSYRGMDFEGFHFSPMTQGEFRKSFMANTGNPYLRNDGGFSHFPEATYNTVILTKEVRGKDSHWCWVNGRDSWYSSGGKVTLVPICRLQGEDSGGMGAAQALRAWLSKELIPYDLSGERAGKYEELMGLWKSGYLVFDERGILLKQGTFLKDVLSGRFRRPVFGHEFDMAAGVEAANPQMPEIPALRRKSSRPGKTAGKNREESGKLLMDEEKRVPLTRERLERMGYPQRVYYDGSLLVDTFITVSGNYVQGYVAAGVYRVASINPAAKTVLLYHSENAKRLFQKNVAFHSVFETFSVPFSRVFVEKGTGARKEGENEATEIDWKALAADLKRGHESLAQRVLVLEQQMKELRDIKDPSPPPRTHAPVQGKQQPAAGDAAGRSAHADGARGQVPGKHSFAPGSRPLAAERQNAARGRHT